MKNSDSDFSLLKELTRRYPRIVGIDEVGRGALAGPIVVAAIEISTEIRGVKDSKLLTRSQRESLSVLLQDASSQLEYGMASNDEIDNLGVSQALKLAYDRALKNITADLILTDNISLLELPHMRSIKGDQIFYPTAAASIVAKVYRDQLMYDLHEKFPQYDWINNVGYGTQRHLDAIKRYGAASWHRRLYLG